MLDGGVLVPDFLKGGLGSTDPGDASMLLSIERVLAAFGCSSWSVRLSRWVDSRLRRLG
jgi:hypothetical protein